MAGTTTNSHPTYGRQAVQTTVLSDNHMIIRPDNVLMRVVQGRQTATTKGLAKLVVSERQVEGSTMFSKSHIISGVKDRKEMRKEPQVIKSI